MPNLRRMTNYTRPHKRMDSTHYLTATLTPINQSRSVTEGGKREHTQNNKAVGCVITSRGGMKAITRRGWFRGWEREWKEIWMDPAILPPSRARGKGDTFPPHPRSGKRLARDTLLRLPGVLRPSGLPYLLSHGLGRLSPSWRPGRRS